MTHTISPASSLKTSKPQPRAWFLSKTIFQAWMSHASSKNVHPFSWTKNGEKSTLVHLGFDNVMVMKMQRILSLLYHRCWSRLKTWLSNNYHRYYRHVATAAKKKKQCLDVSSQIVLQLDAPHLVLRPTFDLSAWQKNTGGVNPSRHWKQNISIVQPRQESGGVGGSVPWNKPPTNHHPWAVAPTDTMERERKTHTNNKIRTNSGSRS